MKKSKRFEDVCEMWLTYKSIGVKESTYAVYDRIVHMKILPRIGQVTFEDLDLTLIMGFVRYLEKETSLSSKSVVDIIVVLKSIVNYANQLHLTEIPVHMIPLPRVVNAKIEIIRKEDMQKLIQYISIRKLPRDFALLISIFAGVRLGEVCALTWANIDLSKKLIVVENTIQRISINHKTKLLMQSAKTKKSIREIPLQTQLESILSMYQKMPDVYIASGTNKALEPRLLQIHLKKTLSELELPNVKFHMLRHTFASQCIRCNVDVKSLSELMGHSSVNITLNKYVHSSIEEKRKQLSKLSFD